MAASTPPAGVSRETAIDLAALERKTYLRSDEAAAYLGYTPDRYPEPLKQFTKFVARHAIPKCYAGRRVLFFRRDLDAFVQRTRAAALKAAACR